MRGSAKRPTPIAAPLVGRADELAALERVVAAAREGQGSAVLLVGDAGIGKTRLAAEAAASARAAGTRVVWATAWEPGGAPAHWHWIQILRSLAADTDRLSLVRELAADVQELARLVPDIKPGVQLAAPGRPEGDDARFRMYDAVSSFLRRASEHQPLLVVLDDLHAGDIGSINLLRFLVSDLGDSPLAVMGMARHPHTDAGAEAAAALTELQRRVLNLTVRGLDRSDVGTMLERIVGGEEAARLAPDVHQRSGGNPLFVGELGLLLADDPDHSRGRPLPATIRAVLERRLAVLPETSLELLRAAAVIGEEFPIDLIADVTGSPRAVVLEAIDHALRTGIVEDRHSTHPAFVFSHGLIREVLYEQLSVAARAGLHRRAGEALEQRSAADPPLAELAHHFLAATAVVADGMAAHYAERAGHRAAEQLAYEDAAAQFRAALAALDLPGADRQRRIPLLLALGDATVRGGDLPAARDAFERAAALARRDERYDLLAQAALGLGSGLDGFEVGLFDHAQITLLEEALARLDDGPSPLRAWAMARLSVALTFAEPQPRRLQLADDAAEMARSVGEPRALAYALAARCDATAGPEHIDQRLDASSEIVRLARAAGDRGMELLGRRNRLIALLESGHIPAVDAEIDSYEMVATALGQPLYRWYVPLWRGMRALMDGRLDAARRHRQEAEAIGARARSLNAALNAEVLAWNTLLKEGQWREAGDVLARQLELADGIYGEPFWVPLIASRAYPAEARAALDRLAAKDFDELPRDAVWLAAMTYAADACGALGHAAVAEPLYELILPHGTRFAVDAIGAACYGSMSRPLGVLATVLGRRSDAVAHFEAAITAHRACGALALVAETLHDHGAALIAFGDDSPGHAILDESRGLYRSLGMERRADLVIAATSDTSAEVAPVGQNIFQREGDYWTLRYAGRTVRVADSKGLRDIAALLARPGRELHVADLIAATDPASGASAERVRTQLLRGGALPDPVLDDRARAGYRARLFELRDELEDAEAYADLGRAEAARAEMDVIAGQLAAAYGLGGRVRPQSDAGERARKAVTQRLRNAVQRLATVHPELAGHLDRSLRTGRFCSYSPEKPIEWSL